MGREGFVFKEMFIYYLKNINTIMASLTQAADIILKKCLNLKKGEKVLIITNPHKLRFVHALFKHARKLAETKLLTIPVARRSGEEPPKYAAREMKLHKVVILMTAYSLTHTKASRDAAKAGARIIASMPGITEATIKRAVDVDYKKMQKQTDKLKKMLDKGEKARVASKAGTDIQFSIKARLAESDTGIIKKGIGNLPGGEAFIAPVENTASGRIIIDGSVLKRKIRTPINVLAREGYAVKISGKKEAKALKETLEHVKDLKAYSIAEFGIGTNPKAKITGNTLEDEKAKGTCHIAFGNNIGFGGKTDVPVHIDGIILNPTIYIDGKMIIKDGKFLF